MISVKRKLSLKVIFSCITIKTGYEASLFLLYTLSLTEVFFSLILGSGGLISENPFLYAVLPGYPALAVKILLPFIASALIRLQTVFHFTLGKAAVDVMLFLSFAYYLSAVFMRMFSFVYTQLIFADLPF